MLTNKEIEDIKEHLEKAQNPIFFFDNDPDGLCSFLLLQRYIGRGKGVAIKSFPDLDKSYFRKVQELKADYIFILDKPTISKDFFEEADKINIPVVCIDHHEVDFDIPKTINYYNPCKEGNGCEPVTALCYQITKRKEDMWISIIGCISDIFIPDYYKDFMEKYPELSIKTNDAFEILYKSKIGTISRIFSSGLKDTTTNVVKMLKYLIKANSPYDVLEENNKNQHLHKRFGQIYEKYKRIFEKAFNVAKKSKKIIFFKYSGDLSISGELSNELLFNFPDKVIIVAYANGSKVNLSLRGKNVREKFLEILKEIDNSNGGGHKDAVGGVIQLTDLDKFKSLIESYFKE